MKNKRDIRAMTIQSITEEVEKIVIEFQLIIVLSKSVILIALL